MAQNLNRENIHKLALRKFDEVVAGSTLAIPTILDIFSLSEIRAIYNYMRLS